MTDKLTPFLDDKLWQILSDKNKEFLRLAAETNHLTFQETRILLNMLRDWEQWDSPPLWERLPLDSQPSGKKWFSSVKALYDLDRHSPPDYSSDLKIDTPPQGRPIRQELRPGNFLGRCPVASEKTRCCNLRTLDSVMGCGFGCHYCSIQSFYDPGEILIQEDLGEKLEALEIDPDEWYHIGTGQSSDSLLWGNQYGLLDKLAAFAAKNPRVILEFKSKSDNISWFRNNTPPRNMILTWSLNTPRVIKNEEPGTASLGNRLAAAREIADKGILTGFHFHPIILYKGWEEDYISTAKTVKEMFRPEELVMISMGTLTYPKKAIRTIRESKAKTKVLKIPLVEIGGKFSYPETLKKTLFITIGSVFKDWEKEVFQYLCMEDRNLWLPVYNREYLSNDAFEKDMLLHYSRKIQSIPENSSS